MLFLHYFEFEKGVYKPIFYKGNNRRLVDVRTRSLDQYTNYKQLVVFFIYNDVENAIQSRLFCYPPHSDRVIIQYPFCDFGYLLKLNRRDTILTMPDEGTETFPGVLRWSAFEHEHIERGSDWFWALGVIAVSAALTSILFGNVLFALLIIVASFTIGLIARTPPEMHEFEISGKGIRISKNFHPYDSIISF